MMIRRKGRMNRVQGFTFLELIIVMCLIAILAIVALDNYRSVLVQAERVTIEQNINMLQNSASTLVAEAIVTGETAAMARYHKANPMRFLLKPPSNYLGEFNQPDLSEIPSGNWYFDIALEHLVYVLKYPDRVEIQVSDPKRLIFQLKLSYKDKNQDGIYQQTHDRLNGLVLEPLIPYDWLKQE